MAIPVSRRLDFSEIPQIDVAPLLSGESNADLISELKTACTDVGFFYVKGHGVSGELISELRAASGRFFDRPMEEKMKVKIDARLRGYLPLDYSSYKDEPGEAKSHQEGFWIGHERPADSHYFLDGDNLWPDGHEVFKVAMLRYQEALEPLTAALQLGFSMAMGMDEDALSPLFERPMTRLKINHYPPQDNPETVKHIGVVAHSDSDAFTILWQDEGDGLEIQNKNDEWIGAPSIPDTFVINIGNIMQIWSNGQFSSTPHRVINRGGRDRFSIPSFVYPGHDAVISPLDSTGTPLATTPICGEYLRKSWRRTFPIANIPAQAVADA